MTETFLENYFEDIAIHLKEIGHTEDQQAFYRITDAMDLDEFDDAVRNMVKSTCLLLEIGEGEIGEWDTQNDSMRIGLHCLVKTVDSGRPLIKAARDTAKAILLKVVSRIRMDCKSKYEREDNLIGPLKAINVIFNSRIKFSNMTDIDGNWYGKSFYFDFKAPVNLVYHNNDWT